MSKITVQCVSKSYSGVDLFTEVSFEVHPGTRLALVGPNGCGKSTLLKIMAGEVTPDSGAVSMTKGAQIGFVHQELSGTDLNKSLEEFVLEVLPSWTDFWTQWQAALRSDDEALLQRLAHRQAELELVYGYNPEHRAHAILSGLGFSLDAFTQSVGALSGGWRERAKLARVLVAGADILFLDEPTNHLDMEAVEWLEDYVLQFSGVVVFVAHDRYFLDRVGNAVLFMGGGKPVLRAGNFSEFLAWQAEVQDQTRRQAERLRSEIEKKQAFVDRFGAKATKAKQAQSRLGQIDRLHQQLASLPAERRTRSLSFTWPEPTRTGNVVLSAVNAGFSFPDKSLFSGVTAYLYRGQKIGLVGPNGRGKSTFIRLITGERSPTAGTLALGSHVNLGYFSQHQTDILCLTATVLAEIRRLAAPETGDMQLKSALGLFLLGESFWEKRVEELSGGEKNRLVLASLFLRKANFLILDEPTNHLDMESREALMDALSGYTGAMLVVAHDRYLLSEVVDEIWELTPEGIIFHQYGFDEFLQRKENEKNAVTQEAVPAVRQCSRQKKREEAELRNRIHQQLKPLKQKFAQFEKDLERNLEDQERVEAILVDPETYSDATKTQEAGRTFKALQETAEELMSKLAWLEKEIQELETSRI